MPPKTPKLLLVVCNRCTANAWQQLWYFYRWLRQMNFRWTSRNLKASVLAINQGRVFWGGEVMAVQCQWWGPTTGALAKAAPSGATMVTWWHSGSFSKLCRHPILFNQHLYGFIAESKCVVFVHKGWQLVGWKLLVALLLLGDNCAVFRNRFWTFFM